VPLVAISAVILGTIRAIVAAARSNLVAKPTLVFLRSENNNVAATWAPILARFDFASPSFLFTALLLYPRGSFGLLDPQRFQTLNVLQFVQHRWSI
jgi:hypothetical protein